jgi:RNA polymerase sigma factor (sigma-70 family)
MSDIALPITGESQLPRAERLLSDELLAKLTGKGSPRAFAAIYERHHQAIYRYCRSILRNDNDAQDALQSSMMRAYAALRDRERDLAVRPWLFRIAHNEAISIVRKRRPEYELNVDLESLDGEVEHKMEVRERLSTLVEDLQQLPERQRAALVMRELSGLSIREIAGALAISQGAAKQTIFEARSSLQELSEGRDMRCEDVREAISLRDGRVLRGRKVRAHLRACEGCRDFRAAIPARGAELHALAPAMPASAASAVLAQLLSHGSHHAAGATSGAYIGGHVASSLVTKGLAGMAVVAAATAGTVRLTEAQHHRPKPPGDTRPGTHASSNTPNGSPATARAGGSTSSGSTRPRSTLPGAGSGHGTSAIDRQPGTAIVTGPNATTPSGERSVSKDSAGKGGRGGAHERSAAGRAGHKPAGNRSAGNHGSSHAGRQRGSTPHAPARGSHDRAGQIPPAQGKQNGAGGSSTSIGGGESPGSRPTEGASGETLGKASSEASQRASGLSR